MKNKINFIAKSVALCVLLMASLIQLFGVVAALSAYHGGSNVPTKSVVVNNKCKVENNTVPQKISINKVGINLPIIPVTLENGTWKVNDGVANYAVETNGIGKTGNMGIFAHNLPNAFGDIKKLTQYDIITISNANYTAEYTVFSIEKTSPNNVSVFDKTTEPIVTLVTCDGLFSEQRYIVKAKLVKLTAKNCNEKSI